MRLALVLKSLQFSGGLLTVGHLFNGQVGGAKGLETHLQAEGTLFKSPQLLKAECHVVHCQIDHKSIVRVLLKLESIDQSLCLLEQ